MAGLLGVTGVAQARPDRRGQPARKPAPAPPRRSPKGSRTRQRLLESARRMFARDGFLGARVTDIATEAGLAHGTFYRYFTSKEDILLALAEATVQELYEESAARRVSDDPFQRLVEGTRGYLAVYQRNADIMKVLIEAAMQNEGFADIWQGMRMRFLQRIRNNIERNRRAGLIREVDPVVASSALGGMVEHFAFMWFVLGGPDLEGTRPTLEGVARTLATLWYHGLFRNAGRTPPGAGRAR